MLARYTSLGFAIVLAFALAACGGGGGSSAKTGTTSTPRPTNVPMPTVAGTATVTASGLQIIDIEIGTGQEAQAGDIAYVNYQEWLEAGKPIDDTAGVPIRQTLRKGETLDGLIEGITGMKVGGKRRLIIPPALGFGDQGSGGIPPNATLIYDIELTAVSQP